MNTFLGVALMKMLRPVLFDSAMVAELALAPLRVDLVLGMLELRAPKMGAPPAGSAVAQRPVVGVAPGALLQRRAVVPLVRAVLLSPPQAAAAVARGVALAVADIFGGCRALSRVCARGSRVLESARAHALVYGIPMYV